MKVKEMRELVSSLQKDGQNQKAVEFVTDTKKFFAGDIKAGVDTMTFDLSRCDFHNLTVDALAEVLSMAGGELDIEVQVGKNKKVVTSTFNGASSLELVAE